MNFLTSNVISPAFRVLICVVFPAFLMAGCKTTKPSEPETFSGVQFEYLAPKKLSDKEKTTVLQLARESGMTNIATVAVNYMLPSSLIGITITSNEEEKGRDITRRLLQIDYNKWNKDSQARFSAETVKRRLEGFTVIGDITQTQKLLKYKDGEMRLQVGDEISLEVAEEILARFMTADVEFRFTADAKALEADLKNAHPVSIETDAQPNSYSIVFWQVATGTRYKFRRDPQTGAIRVVSTNKIFV